MKTFCTGGLVGLAIVCVLALSGFQSARAGMISSDVEISISGGDGNTVWQLSSPVQLDANGNFELGTLNWECGDFCIWDLTVEGNVDPVIAVSFDVSNNTALTQDYTFTFSLPIVAQTPFTATGGSAGITITDGNGGGAALGLHTNGRPTYYSQIDGADFVNLSLLPLIEPNPFQSETASAVFGTPIPSLPGPAAFSTIGIRFDFSLTAGDRAGVTGVFVLESSGAVAEPSTMALLGWAALAAPVARSIGRRRSVLRI